jgi:hypothetical protein
LRAESRSERRDNPSRHARALLRLALGAGLAVLVLALALAAPGALAANEVYCSIRDTNLDLKLQGQTDPRSGDGFVVGSLKGQLLVHHQKVARERRSWSLDGRSLAQFWGVGGELKLRLILQADDEIIDLIIETRSRPGRDGDYAGKFQLVTTNGVRLTGFVECLRG